MLLPFIGVIVFTGVYPKPMLDRIEPSVDALIAHVERRRPGYDVARSPSTIVIEDDAEREPDEGAR